MTETQIEHQCFSDFVEFVKKVYVEDPVPLHRPVFFGKEKSYVTDTIDSNFVSSVGLMVSEFEQQIADYVGAKHGIATVNGTSALHVALILSGVAPGDEVICQALNFVATANAVTYARASPVFVDVDLDSMGMSPTALEKWLLNNVKVEGGITFNKTTGARISACVPMHTFGLPCRIEQIREICEEFAIELIEDAAESLGSFVGRAHTGTFGKLGVFSFNGNKIITTGGGGMIVTNDAALALRAKHITTTAKVKHPWEFFHDEIGFNYRMPNINAAMGCAQLENLNTMLDIKKELAEKYKKFCEGKNLRFIEAIKGTHSNNWLNAISFRHRKERDEFLSYTNANGIMTRPIWQLMNGLPAFKKCLSDHLMHSKWLSDRVVNIPSSVPENTASRFMR